MLRVVIFSSEEDSESESSIYQVRRKGMSYNRVLLPIVDVQRVDVLL